MILKLIIVVLFLLVLLSLSSALMFLIRDLDSPSKRTLYALGIRITLAGVLLATIFYGLVSGQLAVTAPWDSGPATAITTERATP